MPNRSVDTPECEKMQAVKGESQAIGEFLDWMTSSKGYVIAEYPKALKVLHHHALQTQVGDELLPIHTRIEELLAEYFNIDLKKVEKEKRALLEEQRRRNEVGQRKD